ncbi:hypothetical protein EON82_04730 [bacterium]|nr:MAG: hypothetical protein EON82_04730 [bacterium]
MRIESLELLTGDLDAQRTFYERLGLPVRLDEGLRVSAGTSELVFRHEPGFQGVYHFAFDVPYDRIGRAEEFLEGLSVQSHADAGGKTRFPSQLWGAESIYFFDAAGNIEEFIGRSEIASTGDFRVLNVSEVGIACPDVLATAEALSEKLGIGGYRETSEEFFPLGDAEGLFILAKAGRKWYPDTGIPAQELPFRARIRTATGLWNVSADSVSPAA